MIGKALSHYKILSKLGEGGMGVVWKALDTNLDREVAIKILPGTFAADAERLRRFEREAKLLASLNHPNIATVHGLHETDGIHFIAMEFVPGMTLAKRLAHGTVPVDEALEMAGQIAEALETAHERGVIHRDLKPANIMVRNDGTIKVLDFGLAKSSGSQPDDGNVSESPTVTSDGTMAGVILGTAAYMSPEQARGTPLDKRTDIWSFGCVLYEILTGKSCFDGETPSDTLARILEREPDWSAVPEGTPVVIKRLLSRCLRKDPRGRLRDIGEARIAIEDLHAEGATASTVIARRSWRSTLPLAITALMIVCAGVVGWMARQPSSPDPLSPTRLVVSLPKHHHLAVSADLSLAISPDGTTLVYGASSPPGSSPRLFLRKMDRFEAVPIPGSDGAVGPFFSPDSRWLGFFADGKLQKIAVEGGTPLEICHVGQVVPGACWEPDDWIYFTASPNHGLFRVPAGGGTPERLTSPDFAHEETGHGWPHMLPDGDSLLFTISSVDGTHIAVLSLQTGQWRTIEKGMGGARYLSSGHLLFARSEGLAAVPFDIVKLETEGAPVVVLEDVYMIPGLLGFGMAAFSVADTGLLVYLQGGAAAGENRLVWVDRDGRTRPLTSEAGSYEWPRLSRDGKLVAVTDRTAGGQIDIWIIDIERHVRSRLTFDGSNILPTWTPDGKQIVFGSARVSSNVVALFRKSADGSGEANLILDGANPRFPMSWSPNGRHLAFVEWNPDTMRDVWIFSPGEQPETEPILVTQFDEYSSMFSPDGLWLTYVSDESGRYEVYVQSYPVGRGKWLVSAGGGIEPVWSASGREIFYRNGDAMMVVPIRTEPEFEAGTPALVFEKALVSGIYGSLSYDISPDGQQFLMIERDIEMAPNQLNVVLNWREELQQKVPVTPK